MRESLRVLIISSSYYPQKGGLQEVVGRLAEGLVQRHHQVSVMTNRFPVSLSPRERVNGIEVRRLPFFAPDFEDVRQGRPGLYLACYFISVWTLGGLLKHMLAFRPDIVNIHFPLNQVPFYNLIHPFFPEVPVIVSLHGNDIEQYLSDQRDYDQDVRKQTERALHHILSKADEVTAPSKYLIDRTESFHPGIGTKAMVIPNGIAVTPPPHQAPIRSRPYLLGVGRLTYRKGFDLLLGAFRSLAPVYPELDLVLLGEGEMRPELEAIIRQSGLSGRIEMPGWVEHSQITDWMAHAEMVVVPSRQEGFGMVALEGMAAGRPVVATNVGALPELLGDMGNPIVAPETEALMQGIIDLVESPQRRLDVGRKNKIHAVYFQWESVLDQYIDAYRSVLKCDNY